MESNGDGNRIRIGMGMGWGWGCVVDGGSGVLSEYVEGKFSACGIVALAEVQRGTMVWRI